MDKTPIYLWLLLAFMVGFVCIWLKSRELKMQILEKESAEGSELPDVLPVLVGSRPPRIHEKHKPPKVRSSKPARNPEGIFAIFKWSSKRRVEVYQFGITISASFIGLFTSFMLNNWKANKDKKIHLISLLKTIQKDEVVYKGLLTAIDSIEIKDSALAHAVFLKSIKIYDYPFLQDISDPSIYDISSPTFLEVRRLDHDVKIVLSEATRAETNKTPIPSYLLPAINLLLNETHDQINVEVRYLSDSIGEEGLQSESNVITQIVSNALRSSSLAH